MDGALTLAAPSRRFSPASFEAPPAPTASQNLEVDWVVVLGFLLVAYVVGGAILLVIVGLAAVAWFVWGRSAA